MDDAAAPLPIVGDIHGQADRLLAVLLSPESEERRIVFVKKDTGQPRSAFQTSPGNGALAGVDSLSGDS